MKKVLIVSYYWPPSGGSGVQRWLKFTKYLPQYKIKPYLLIPENPLYPQTDNSLQKDIPEDIEFLKVPIWEPYEWFQKITGINKKDAIQASSIQNIKQNSWKSRFALWIRSNLFIPDARMFWIRPASKKLIKYLRDKEINIIISTGPPHSTHMIAYRAKKAIPKLKWIADFRDPWTNIDFYQDLSLTKWANRRHIKLEKKVLYSASKVITVSKTWGKEFEVIGNREIEVITNGFDIEDTQTTDNKLGNKLTITHIGTLGKTRNPEALWQALATIKKAYPDKYNEISIRFIGNVDQSAFTSAKNADVLDITEHIKFVNHSEIFNYLTSSDLLLLIVNDAPNAMGIIPAKVFEYIASGRPIICLGPEKGDLAGILKEFDNSIVVSQEEPEKLVDFLINYKPIETNISKTAKKYSRRTLTERLVTIINEIDDTHTA